MKSLASGMGVLAFVLWSSAAAQVTERASVSSTGVQGDAHSEGTPSISADGRFVAFYSYATNLVADDTNDDADIFVRDRWSGTIERVSVSSAGTQGSSWAFNPSISGDGRFVAFESDSPDLVPDDLNGIVDIFVRDRQSGTTALASLSSSGTAADSFGCFNPSISADGRFVAFASSASNLVLDDTNGTSDIFVRDRTSGTTERISLDSEGVEGNDSSYSPSISADGRFVAFVSYASNLVVGDMNGVDDVFVHDRQTGTTERVSVDSAGVGGAGSSSGPAISADGRYVVFQSEAANLVSDDTNLHTDIFLRDRVSGTTELVSLSTRRAQGDDDSLYPAISADGRWVTFSSYATDLVSGDTNAQLDVFTRDRLNGTTERASVATSGAEADHDSAPSSISADGRFVAFDSFASNLVANDTNGAWDVFVHDRDATGFSSLCDPSVAGVIDCPCSNSPSGPGRGCDNSSSTGGAVLSASGFAYLSLDSLVFTTSGEKPTATSIVLQGDELAADGLVFGQGVRCAGGTLSRLYTKHATAGSITAPNIAAGDPTVSVRSAALGDLLQAGQSRWYVVYYRDPNVLGDCSSDSTFNATQTGEIAWSF